MADDKNLKTVMERKIKALRLRPSVGQGTATTKVRVRNGVTCEIEDGGWTLVADQATGDGGEGLGPDPGAFGRAALGSCLAIGYITWASYMEVPIESVDVVVEADYDARGMYAVDDSVSPGWAGVRYIVHITSPADEDSVRKLVEFADRHSPLLADFRDPLTIKRELRITQTAEV